MKCDQWPSGQQCQGEAVYWLYYGAGKPCPGGLVCADHAKAIIQEYRQKLGQEWFGVPVNELGDVIPLSPLFRAE